MDELKEKLNALIESAESYDDACDQLSDAIYELGEAMDNTPSLNDNLRNQLDAFIKKHDPVLEIGSEIIYAVDDFLQDIEDIEATKN